MSCLDLFPQLGYPVLAERCVDLTQMQVWVVTIPPARELTDLAFVATHGLSTARATALTQKALHQQRVAPKDGSGCCCTERHGGLGPGIWRRYRVKMVLATSSRVIRNHSFRVADRGQ